MKEESMSHHVVFGVLCERYSAGAMLFFWLAISNSKCEIVDLLCLPKINFSTLNKTFIIVAAVKLDNWNCLERRCL